MRIGVFVGSSRLLVSHEAVNLGVSELRTPWGDAAALPQGYALGEHELILLPRHGAAHALAPHQINYRANVWLLHSLHVDCVIGTYTVGGIDPQLNVGDVVVPQQIVDYTWGRASTYDDELRHIDFSYPFDQTLRQQLLAVAPDLVEGGTYACSQGPRLETAAEIRRMARDGCSLVGMTAMPEAGLCRELDLKLAALCLIVNPAAGVVPGGPDPATATLAEAPAQPIDLSELQAASRRGAARMLQVIEGLLPSLS
ncbi:MAG: S-methyl-5'-thioinosine phosphorylase [Pseudomonadota bacterium]